MSAIAIAGGSGRTILTANKVYNVSVTGSDSGDGSVGSPWATLQHAMNFIAGNLDIAGFIVTVNIGAGSFAGFGIKSAVGGGIILFKGAGSGSTTITNGPNDGVFNFGQCVCLNVLMDSIIGINAVKFAPTGSMVAIFQPGFFFYIGDPAFNATTDIIFDCTNVVGGSVRLVDIEGCSIFQDAGPSAPSGAVTVTGANKTVNFFIILLFGANFQNISPWTVSGNLTVSQPLCTVQDAAMFVSIGGTFTGAGVTAQRFLVTTDGVIDCVDSAGTFFPGSSAGVITSGGQYSGISDYNGNVAGLPTATVKGARAFVTDGNAPVFSNAIVGGGAIYTPIYADGASWRAG